jgi:CubicO group peptidase (beta-lactamase class C family)
VASFFKLAALGVTAVAVLTGCASLRIDKAARAATGVTSHMLCDDIYISGRDPATAYAERVKPLKGMGPFEWAVRWQADPARREVTVSLAGGFDSRAVHRPGLGCLALPASEHMPTTETVPTFAPVTPMLADISGGPMAARRTPPRLAEALASALAPTGGERHNTKAVVVLRDGQLIGERYASGYGPDTPLPSFSLAKSVTSTLIGVLVRQGRLNPDAPGVLPEWRNPADPRHAITVNHLLRQTSGLDLLQNNSGFDPSTQIMYSVRDKAGASAEGRLAVPPGERWAYSDTNYLLLGRVLRNAVGGSAQDVVRFAQQELFGPLGMDQVTLSFDATGSLISASHMLASARDWARLGQLWLDDGVAGGQRILPAGWMRHITTPTLDTAYGAGLWTHRLGGQVFPKWGVPWGLANAPADAYFGRGFMGQYVVVIPSERLVIVRMSISHEKGDDIGETDRIVGEVRGALKGSL